MRTIDDRLTQASNETQSQIATMELQDRSTVERRVRASRILAGATAVVLVFGAFGVTALLVGSDGDQASHPEPGAPPLPQPLRRNRTKLMLLRRLLRPNR